MYFNLSSMNIVEIISCINYKVANKRNGNKKSKIHNNYHGELEKLKKSIFVSY